MTGVLFQLAVRNLLSHKSRAVVAGAGICFAIFLMFLQWGLLIAAKKESTLLYDYFDFDLAVVSQKYQLLYSPGNFDRVRMTQALALDLIEDSFSLNLDSGRWIDTQSLMMSSALIIGIDDKPNFITDVGIRKTMKKLIGSRSILVDQYSHADFGLISVGEKAKLNNREVDIRGQFKLGLFFYAEGSVLVRNDVFYNLTNNHSRETNIGLIKLKVEADLTNAKAQLKDTLPDDVIILTKRELIDQEQSYFVKVKPLGLMFETGMFIAFFTGVVVLFQVMSTEIGSRIKEYATIKAMGYGAVFIYGVAIVQVLILSISAFIPAVVLSHALFLLIDSLTHLPIEITQNLFTMILSLTLIMAVLAGVISLQKLSKVDPAELF